MHGTRLLDAAWQDARYSLRGMRKSLAFTLTAVLTMAIGIGANTAIFTVVHAVLLKPLAYRDPGRLVQVIGDGPQHGVRDNTFRQPQFDAIRPALRSFSSMGVYLDMPENMTISGAFEPEAIKGARVSANFLDILGIQPLLGRSFLREEERPGAPAVAMISSGLWQRRFASDARVLGKTVMLNDSPCAVIGVLPLEFSFPFPGMDIWVTKPAEASAFPSRYWYILSWLVGFGRLNPGVTLQQASAELDLVTHRYAMEHPDRNEAMRMRLIGMKNRVVANVRPTLWILFGVVAFVLLIACANVAGLLLAKATSRSREFAVRSALGAPRLRLIRQLLVESLLLSAVGGLLGLLLAKWVLNGAAYIRALQLPGIGQMRLDGTVLGFTIAISALTGLLFGLFPSLLLSRPDVSEDLRESGSVPAHSLFARATLSALSTRGALVIGQVAFSIVLLISAALLLQSFARLHNVDPGFQRANLLTAKLPLPPVRYNTAEKKLAFLRDLTQRVEAIPGISSAAVAMSLPTTSWLRTNIQIQGLPWETDPAKWPSVQIQSITPEYFHTLGVPIERGREFTERDNTPGAAPAIIINESFARQFSPAYPLGVNPVGQHLREGADRTGWVEIVGVVANVREGGLAMDALPEFYVPCAMHPPQVAYLVVRTRRDPSGFVKAIRKRVQAIDPDEPLSEVGTMDRLFASSLDQRRVTALLLGSFAGVALLLAVIGTYGGIAYSVAQRTRELGVRRALGAQQSHILRLVIGQALTLVITGVGIGIAGAFVLTRLMSSLLFQLSATDPATFVGVAILFLLIALAASYLPARRAARIDPMAALRVG